MVRGRKDKFPSERRTIMMDDEIDSLIKKDYSAEILKSVKDKSKNTSSSYSKVLNEKLAQEFAKGTDKKILRDAKEK